MFALAQEVDGIFVGCVHTQVESANPLDRHDLSTKKAPDGLSNRVGTLNRHLGGRLPPHRRTQRVPAVDGGPGLKPDMRTTAPAGIRLRVKAAIERVVVFGLALGAHGKRSHRGLRPVVRDATRNGKARPAVGAVQKRITIAAVGGVEQFAKTIGAGGGVRGDTGTDPAEHLAGDDAEACLASGRQIAGCHRIDARQRRSLRSEAGKKCLNLV